MVMSGNVGLGSACVSTFISTCRIQRGGCAATYADTQFSLSLWAARGADRVEKYTFFFSLKFQNNYAAAQRRELIENFFPIRRLCKKQ